MSVKIFRYEVGIESCSLVNNIFLEIVDVLESDIKKIAEKLEMAIADCQREAEKRIGIEKNRKTKGHNPTVAALIGGAYLGVQSIHRLQKNAVWFMQHGVSKETLEKIIYLRFRLASEAYGVAVGGQELKVKKREYIELRNEEWRIYATVIKKENCALSPSDVTRKVMKKFELNEDDKKSFRQVYRVIFRK